MSTIWKTEKSALKSSITIEDIWKHLKSSEMLPEITQAGEAIQTDQGCYVIYAKQIALAEKIKHVRLTPLCQSIKANSPKLLAFVYEYMCTLYHDFAKRASILQQYNIEIKLFLETVYYSDKHPYDILVDYIKELDTYCFQGGFGHSVRYTGSPHHWCMKPEYYETMGEIPGKIVEIQTIYRASLTLYSESIFNTQISISPIAKDEVWGN